MSNKRQKLETDVLALRNQAQWEKAKEGLKQLINKYGSSDPAVKLIECETEVEIFFLEHEPRRENVNKALSSLAVVQKSLRELQSSECKNSLFQVPEEAMLLLAKVHYAQGNLSTSLDVYANINLDTSIKEASHLYKLRMLSEAYSIKGLCLEQSPVKSSGKDNDLHMKCYQQAITLLIKYLIEYEKVFHSRNMITDDTLVSFVIETAIHNCTVLQVKNGDIWKGVDLLRTLIKTLHSKLSFHFQQSLSCKLAMILLRGTSTATYKSEDGQNNQRNDSPTQFLSMDKKSEMFPNLTEPQPSATNSFQTKPKFFLGENEFKPSTIEQEAILLLLISEIMLNVDPVLDMSPEHAESREETLRNAETVYNLLSVACVHLGQYELISSSIEKSLKYAFDRHHIWFQYALALYSAGKGSQALRCFSECCQVKEDDTPSALLAAKTCYEQQPPQTDEGLLYSQLAIKMSEETFENEGLLSRAHLSIGVGYSLKALSNSSRKEQSSFRSLAEESYAKAHSFDPHDHKPLLLLGLEFAQRRKIPLAFKKVKQALELNPEDIDALHLLTLLLTSHKQYDAARLSLHAALDMYPEDIRLLATKCKLEQHTGNCDEALRTCDEIMTIWASKPESNLLNTDNTFDRMTNDAMSATNLSLGLELETGSIMAGSAILSKYGQTGSDVTSLTDLQPRLASISSARAEAWLQVAEVYLTLDRPEEAQLCVTEAGHIHPLLSSFLYMKGRLSEHRGELVEACTMYNNTLTVDPSHIKATEHLAIVLRRQGRLGFAKKLLQDAAKLDAMSHTIWQQLAEILESDGDIDAAVECSNWALNLEENSPILPFTIIIPSL